MSPVPPVEEPSGAAANPSVVDPGSVSAPPPATTPAMNVPQARIQQPMVDHSPAAQWRRACMEQLAWGKRMVEDGLSQCPKSGYMRQNCVDYYRGLERHYQGVTCDPKGGGMPMPGW
ncbi:MAG: hypothetical protein HQL98_14950 [Magnetococcales bacterium]|nr:hypothetical protein [Magnetococcales bacterium]